MECDIRPQRYAPQTGLIDAGGPGRCDATRLASNDARMSYAGVFYSVDLVPSCISQSNIF